MSRFTSFLLFISISLLFAQQTQSFSWENGETILGSYGNLTDAMNVGETNDISPYDGNSMLTVSESPLSGTPQAFIGYITGLNGGDEVTASYYAYDDIPGTGSSAYPSLRIWGGYALNDDITSYEGSASGPSDFSTGIGWEQLSHTWTVEEGKEALVIQARLYSPTSGGSDPTQYFIDLVEITAPNGATINFPGSSNLIYGCTDPNATNYNPEANTDDGTCEYESTNVSIYDIQGQLDASPYIDQVVTTSGIVTGTGSYGYFVQSGDGQWSGVWVYTGSTPSVQIGDDIILTGMVVEYNDLTEIEEMSVSINSSGNNLPSPISITSSELTEGYESVYVTVSGVCTSTADNYGEWVIEDSNGEIVVNDTLLESPYIPQIGADYIVSGPLNYSFGNYKVEPIDYDYITENVVEGLPIADAGIDQQVEFGSLVTLDGTSSYDPNGSILGYTWYQQEGPLVNLSSYEDAQVTFTAPDDFATFVFSLEVIDDEFNISLPSFVTIVVGFQTVYDIQYSNTQGEGDDCYPSPYTGSNVTVTGVVTAVNYNASKFFIQDESLESWAGVYVFDDSVTPSEGDVITLTAEVDEYYGLTELKNVSSFSIIGDNEELNPIEISTGTLGLMCSQSGEMYEGMLVEFDSATVQTIDEFGAVYIDDGSGGAKIDDYFFDGTWPSFADGDVIDSVVGVAHYYYGEYVVYPRDIDDLEGGGDVDGPPECALDCPGLGDYSTESDFCEFFTSIFPDNSCLDDCDELILSELSEINDYCIDCLFDNSCDFISTTIYDIQYTTNQGEYCYETDLEDEIVGISGVVTHISFNSAGVPNLFVQDPDTDSLWSGITVFGDIPEGFSLPNIGDLVNIVGTVNEYYSLTQITDITEVTIISSDNQIDPVSVNAIDIGIECSESGEMHESMLVTLSNISFDSVDEFGNWTISDNSGSTRVDDYHFQGTFPDISVGDSFECITGVISYSYSEFKVYPRDINDFSCSECIADGDVNSDDNLDVLDVVMIVNYALGSQEFTDDEVCSADYNGDDNVDVLDIVSIVNEILN